MSYGTPPGYGGGGYGAPPPGGGYGGGYGGAYGQPPQQPYGAGGGGYQSPPPNHLVWSILTLFCCSVPVFGILAIVFAAQVNGKFQAGDYNGALDSSNKARMFALIGTILGVLQWIGVILYIIVVGLAVSHSTPTPSFTSTY